MVVAVSARSRAARAASGPLQELVADPQGVGVVQGGAGVAQRGGGLAERGRGERLRDERLVLGGFAGPQLVQPDPAQLGGGGAGRASASADEVYNAGRQYAGRRILPISCTRPAPAAGRLMGFRDLDQGGVR